MTRQIAGVLLLALPMVVAGQEAAAQSLQARVMPAQAPEAAQATAAADGQLYGTVVDDTGAPLPGVVVSAMGMTTAFSVTDDMGRFMFRGLPVGPYLVRAHLKGFAPARAREVQVTAAGRTASNFELSPHQAGDEETVPAVLAAGFGPDESTGETPAETSAEDQERAWRLRHLRRSVLKEADTGMVLAGNGDAFTGDFTGGDVLSGVGRLVLDAPVRLATALFTDPAASAEFNFLTTTSFSQPQDLFSGDAELPRGIAYVAFEVPDGTALWSVQGAMTQGDLASWVLAGSYLNETEGAHVYGVGMSYSMQRYAGGNRDALKSIGDGRRNSGAVSAFDRWTLAPGVELEYGGRYAVYDYLDSRGLLSPRASLAVAPISGDSLRVRVAVSRDSVAPGAAEFLPPASGLLLPPERTFSPLVDGAGFVPEEVSHVEVGVEREMPGAVLVGVRAFRQNVTDQNVTLFGAQRPGAEEAIGHYYVGSVGDLAADGVGVRVSRDLLVGLTGSVDYTLSDASWLRSAAGLPLEAVGAQPGDRRVHDLTTSVAGEVPATATRVFFVYRLNTGLTGAEGAPLIRRFDLRVNQALPFGFASAQWEMLVAVRNLFHDSVTDTSVFDEALVVSPPKQIVGGLTVRF